MSTEIYWAKDVTPADKEAIVTDIHLIGSAVIGEPHLHWRMFLVTELGSICLDMGPYAADGNTGILMIESCKDGWTSDALGLFTTKTSAALSAQDIVALFEAKGRHRYKFSPQGTGCRHWCITLLEDCVEEGIISHGADDSFRTYIVQNNAAQPDVYPLPAVQGTFY